MEVYKGESFCNRNSSEGEDCRYSGRQYCKPESSEMGVALNLESGVVSFFNAKGEPLLSENGKPEFTDFNDAGTKTFTVKQTFLLDKDEPLYGLGILQNGKMSQRNQTKRLVQGNVEDVVPFVQSVKGYGLFWDNYSPTNLPINRKEPLSSPKWEIASTIISCTVEMLMA